MLNYILFFYGLFIFYIAIGAIIWINIDEKTRYKNNDDEYLKLPIILGSFFSYFFIKKIKEKRKIYVIIKDINYYKHVILYLGFDGLSDDEKEKYVLYNRILKINKIKKRI